MTDFADELASEQANPNALLMEILTSGYELCDYIVAIEGPDDQGFYFDYLVDCLETKSLFILQCKGKPPLLELKRIAEGYTWAARPKMLFICDKDFDDYLGELQAGVWYTPWYSIENALAQPAYVGYVVSKYAPNTLAAADRTTFLEEFERLFYQFTRAVLPYCALMCEIRANGEHPKFDDFGIDELFDLTQPHSPRKPHIFARATAAFALQKAVPLGRVVKRMREFRPDPHSSWLRGKLAMQLARKSYHLAYNTMSSAVRSRLPRESRIDTEALNHAKVFLPELPSLADHCRNHTDPQAA